MILLSIGTLRYYELDRVFGIAADLGFDGIELIVDERYDVTDPVYLKRLMDRYGLPVPAVHSPFGFLKTTAWGGDPVERMERSIELAGLIGASVVIFHLPFFAERRYERWIVNKLSKWQENTGIKLAVENMPHAYKVLGWLGIPFNTPAFYEADSAGWPNRILRFFSKRCFKYNDWESLLQFDHLVLDTTHYATSGGDPVEAYERMRHKLALIHISNFDGEEHQPLRKGNIDMERFLKHVKAGGYGGIITLELMPERFPDLSEETAIRILAEDLAFCRRLL